MIEDLRRWGEARGYRVGWGPLEVVDASLADLAARGMSPALTEYAAESISDEGAERLRARGLNSVVVVAMPRPAHQVTFETDDGRLETILPPTYYQYRGTFEKVRVDLAREALPGRRVETLMAPIKQVAARLGLVSYGRNNVTYAGGLGSYIQLLGYLTDAVLPVAAGWRPAEPALLGRCLKCTACVKSCPTGAIRKDRFLLDADRCLTFANEREGSWPAWLDPGAHHALLGCLACQRRCPENGVLAVAPSGVVFDRDETRALLAEPEPRELPVWREVRAKLALLGQSYSEDVVGRNLRALARLAS